MIGRIAHLRRHPVKGFTPERLVEVSLKPGGHFPFDRIYAVERGRSGFDPDAPQHLSKWRFAVLANHARLARVATTYDERTHTLAVALDGRPELSAKLSTPEGRDALAAWLAAYLGDHEDEALAVIGCGPAHRFMDDRDGCVSVVNLESVRALGARIGATLDPMRMRANIYVEGWPAWAEQGLGPGVCLNFAGVRMQVIKPIPRCIAIHVDPTTGERDLHLLGALREHYGHVNCGLYLRVCSGGRLAEGDLASLDTVRNSPETR